MRAKMLDLVAEKLEEARNCRMRLAHVPVCALRNASNPEPGAFVSNYAGGLLNRQIDIFDDAILLLDNGRLASACAVARGMLETYAMAIYATDEIAKVFNKGTTAKEKVKGAVEKVLSFTNSSRFKKTQQEKLAKGIFELSDFHFTEEAQARMLNSLAGNVHVMNALRFLYDEQKKRTGSKESATELAYDGLSEWVHPSQTSVWHRYSEEVHLIDTSMGKMHLNDSAMIGISYALHFITASQDVYEGMVEVADKITLYAQRNPKWND